MVTDDVSMVAGDVSMVSGNVSMITRNVIGNVSMVTRNVTGNVSMVTRNGTGNVSMVARNVYAVTGNARGCGCSSSAVLRGHHRDFSHPPVTTTTHHPAPTPTSAPLPLPHVLLFMLHCHDVKESACRRCSNYRRRDAVPRAAPAI